MFLLLGCNLQNDHKFHHLVKTIPIYSLSSSLLGPIEDKYISSVENIFLLIALRLEFRT